MLAATITFALLFVNTAAARASHAALQASTVATTAQSHRVESRPAMTQWMDVAAGRGLTLKIPPDLGQSAAQGIDTTVTSWTGKGISILVDQGWFADSLASSVAKSGYTAKDETIGGRPARIVSYVEPTGTRVVAAHFAGSRSGSETVEPVTVAVRLEADGPNDETALTVIRSLRFGKS